MRLWRYEAHPGGTDRGDKEAEEDGERKDKFVAKSERLPFVSAPLETGRNAKRDEENTVEKGLKNETNQRCRRYGYHLLRGGGSAGRTGIKLCQRVGYIAIGFLGASRSGFPHHRSPIVVYCDGQSRPCLG